MDGLPLLRQLLGELARLLVETTGRGSGVRPGVPAGEAVTPPAEGCKTKRVPASRYSARCAEDVFEVLKASQRRRLSQTQVLDALARRGTPWSASCCAHTLSELVRRGDLTSARDSLGSGYGLPAWEGEAAG